ncbi:phage tail assembly protein [Brachymonas chironomi]|uniref:phage tail assembly protein n=1 Tax=Brachymonas chironomi TaxID=491919 RepID=UPI00037362CE|nr:phage tail assembly protein [Brachymonas chironomi]
MMLQPVELKTPIKTPNGEIKTITLMREPTRRDLKQAQQITTDEEEQVWHMICALSDEKLTIEDTDALTLADVRQVMEMFRSVAGI